MDESNEQNLDTEYKRYLEIMRPYLGQLLDQDVIEVCNAWIQRLSNCKDNEKSLRNKYIFSMCYQLAKGVLEDPFLNHPSSGELSPLTDINSEEYSSEIEYQIVDLENTHTQVIYNNDNLLLSATEDISHDSEFKTNTNKTEHFNECNKSINSITRNEDESIHKQNFTCYNCSTDMDSCETYIDNYHRAKNVLIKLQEIKKQNLNLQREVLALKEELSLRNELENSQMKINNATSTCTMSQDSVITLKSKIQEIRESRNTLLEKVSNLQDKLDNLNYIKTHEIEDLETKHKMEIINVKTSVREETKSYYENKLENIKQQYEQSIKDIQIYNSKEIEKIITNKDEIISEKDKTILSKNLEIETLKNCIENLKKNQSSFANSSNHSNGDSNSENLKQKAEELEKRLNKMEKSKIKCFKAYDIKLVNLQKEKHLIECSFHLELVRQRAQVIHEIADEHQTELATALNKLESKYKEIVANVQSMAVQRRIQDQIALESIIQAVCGARNEGMYTNSAQATCPSQLTNKATRNQTRDGSGSCDIEMPTIFRGNKVGSVIVGSKSFGEDIMVNDYCLDSEKLGEFFEKLYIPQRDMAGDSSKK